jgi:hypothetical protein
MKAVLVLLLLIFLPLLLQSQDMLSNNWQLSLNLSIQAHDKRLYNFAGKEHTVASQPESFGTYQLGISFSRKLALGNKINILAGIGLSTELSTFERPFDQLYGKSSGIAVLMWTNRYYKYLLQAPVNLRYELSNEFGFSLEILPQFSFLTVAKHDKDKDVDFSWSGFDLYSIELNPGIDYSIGKFNFGIKYRGFQFKKIDKIIFNRIIKDPRTDQKNETYNPFKAAITIGYNI